jgi:hypothetical protein
MEEQSNANFFDIGELSQHTCIVGRLHGRLTLEVRKKMRMRDGEKIATLVDRRPSHPSHVGASDYVCGTVEVQGA